jgi:hypothetical protein
MDVRTLFHTTTLSIAVIVVLAAAAQAQSSAVPVDRPKFDVASIKPNKSGEQGTYLRRQPGGLYKAANVPLRALIASAYLNEFPPRAD